MIVEFYDDQGVIGTVKLQDNELTADDTVRGYVNNWLRSGQSPKDFEHFYSAWSNGYVSSRKVSPVDQLRDRVARAEL